MRLFLDSANIEEVREVVGWGIISGVTTNPSLMAQGGGKDFRDHIREIAGLVTGPVSAEVVRRDVEGMVAEARELAAWASNVVVKIPIDEEGVAATARLSRLGVKTNLTLCFSTNQALLAAQVGATYVSPFVGRLDDVGQDGMALVAEIVDIYRRYGIATQVIAASIRHPEHCVQAAKAGANIATVPFRVLRQMFRHPLTELGIEQFLKDWAQWQAQGTWV